VKQDASVKAAFQMTKPDVVLLFAAMSDIDRCEQSPEEAFAVNVRGAEHVANACVRANARLLFTSSAAVFDGTKHGYCEDSAPNPVSVYGKTKAQAETVVQALASSGIVVRIALALGFAGRAGTNALLDNLAKRWAAGEAVALPTFEYRNPIDGCTFSRFILELLNKLEACGIFHVGSTEPISRYELGLKLATRMGYSGLVRPQWEPTRGRAPRGPDHFLLTDKIRAVCTTTIPTYEQVIERCFDGAA
jgi:dTDP-4-dehydrorhamnose reductase